MNVELVVGRRVVHKLIKDDGQSRHDNAEIVAPSPSRSGVKNKRPSDDWSEHCNTIRTFLSSDSLMMAHQQKAATIETQG